MIFVWQKKTGKKIQIVLYGGYVVILVFLLDIVLEDARYLEGLGKLLMGASFFWLAVFQWLDSQRDQTSIWDWNCYRRATQLLEHANEELDKNGSEDFLREMTSYYRLGYIKVALDLAPISCFLCEAFYIPALFLFGGLLWRLSLLF